MYRVLMSIVLCLIAAPAMAAERPNFLVVITDDQRYDALGVVQREQGEQGRFPWFETPNMDRLARQGARFRNAFVVCSLCSPSRAAYLTGRYNHHNGIAGNRTPLPEDTVTYASLLREAGYTTGYTGKWHMDGQSGQRPGFDYSASFVGQGRYFDCPFEINGKRTETTGWVDDVSTDFAIEFLKRQEENPFLLIVGFKTPHGPRTKQSLPERLAGLYADVEAKPPVSADEPPPYREADEGRTGRRKRRGRPDLREGMRVYFQLLRGVDENLGRLLGALEETGVANNTVVVFASDNGYFLGEHGLGDKRAAYEDALRIPLLVRLPGGEQGATIDAMTLNIDLAPTLLDLAGVPVPEAMQGRSLRPLLEGESPGDWRTEFFYEYFTENPFPTPTVFALRTETAKLIRYPGRDDWTELYDLQSDPHEMSNLITDPGHADLRQRMQARFEQHARELGLPRPLPERAPESGR